MDATASVVSLVSFTIKSVVVIRQAITSIKEGPETLTSVAKDAHLLQHILQRLESSPAAQGSQDAAFQETIKSCAADVTSMTRKLDEFDFKPGDRTGIKLWKSAKSVFKEKEKEWESFRGRVYGYSSYLITFITMEDSDKLFDMNRKMDDGLELQRFIQEELLRVSNRFDSMESRFDEVGAAVKNRHLLGTHIVDTLYLIMQDRLQSQAGIENDKNPPEALTEPHWNTSEVLANSSVLQDFYPSDRVRLASTPIKPATVNKQTLTRLIKWSQPSSSPQMLWIKGKHTLARDSENPMTRVGLQLIKLADEHRPRNPMITYFCPIGVQNKLERDETTETRGMNSMLYAFIRQILETCTLKFGKSIDVSANRFQGLDGSKARWDDALAVLRDLISQLDHPVFCILDGVQRLEHPITQRCWRKLVEILRGEHMNVLFITTGSSAFLRDTVSVAETLGEKDLGSGALKEDLAKHSQKFWK